MQNDLLQQAIKKSVMLKLSKCGKLVKRRIPFDLKRIDLTQMDQCTVYVENFPDSLSLQDIAKIFSRAGEIRNITLPKFGAQSDSAMDTDESCALIKGFCFVEFASAEAANRAADTFNNCIPEELTNAEHKNYVSVQGTLSQFNVMSKETWQAFKEEARKIRQEIAKLNASTMFAPGADTFEGFKIGTLVRMHHNFDTALL